MPDQEPDNDPVRAKARALAAAAPPPTPELVERIRMLMRPAVEAWWVEHDAEVVDDPG